MKRQRYILINSKQMNFDESNNRNDLKKALFYALLEKGFIDAMIFNNCIDMSNDGRNR